MNQCSECGGIGRCKPGCGGSPQPPQLPGVIEIPCTAWEKQLIEKVAAISDVTPAEFVRDAALKRAHEVIDVIAATASSDGAA